MSLQHLAGRVGVAPSHVFHIEKGDKVPSESLASQLAAVLGEDPELFRAWARARSRTDVYTALDSARVLARYLRAGAPDGATAGSPRAESEWAPSRAPAALEEPGRFAIEATVVTPDAPGPTRVLVPVLDAGAPAAPRPVETLRLDPRALESVTPLERPFALALTPEIALRVAGRLPAHGHAILTRFRPPIDPREIYAVRDGLRLVLSHAMWNGQQLLLVPAPGRSDFVTLPVTSGDDLARHVVGRVVLVRPGA